MFDLLRCKLSHTQAYPHLLSLLHHCLLLPCKKNLIDFFLFLITKLNIILDLLIYDIVLIISSNLFIPTSSVLCVDEERVNLMEIIVRSGLWKSFATLVII